MKFDNFMTNCNDISPNLAETWWTFINKWRDL